MKRNAATPLVYTSRFHLILVATGVLAIFANLGRLAKFSLGLPLSPAAVTILAMTCTFPLVIGNLPIRCIRPSMLTWAYTYFVMGCLWALDIVNQKGVLSEIITRMAFCFVLIVYSVVFSVPGTRLFALRAIAIATFILSIYMIYEGFSFNSGSSNAKFRAEAWMGNPNTAGLTLVVGLTLTFAILPVRLRGALIVLTGIAIAFTLSRGAIICYLLALGGIFLCSGRGGKSNLRLFWSTMLAAIILVGLSLINVADLLLRTGLFNIRQLERVGLVGGASVQEDARLGIAESALKSFLDHPMLGLGTAQYMLHLDGVDVGPHNAILSLMMQHGIAGLMLFAWLIGILLYAAMYSADPCYGRLFAIIVVAASFFNHVMFFEYHWALSIAIISQMPVVSADPVVPAPNIMTSDHNHVGNSGRFFPGSTPR